MKNDNTLEVINDILDDVALERVNQIEKWGPQDHRSHYDQTSITRARANASYWKQVNDAREESPNPTSWDGILLEEVYEAIAETDEAKIREELVQVAAVAAAWIEAIDRRLHEEADEDALQDELPEAA